MEFKIGDRVVYPSQGVALIEDVVEKQIGGLRGDFYLLQMESKRSTVMVPISNTKLIGLRHLSSKARLKELFGILRGDESEPDPDWKIRHKQNVENMKEGSLLAVGRVLKDLHTLSEKKTLGLRDRKMLDQARRFVTSEVAAVQGISEDEAEDQIDQMLLAAGPATG